MGRTGKLARSLDTAIVVLGEAPRRRAVARGDAVIDARLMASRTIAREKFLLSRSFKL